MRNVELKARLPLGSLERARATVRALGASDGGEERQLDTYFRLAGSPAARLRLKARETADRAPEIIAYRRADEPSSRLSDYHIVRGDVLGMKEVLAEVLGVSVVVDKRREVWIWRNVRIHLDRVEGLGEFIEFEAVLSEGEDEGESFARIAELARRFEIADSDRIRTSYGDLLLESRLR